MSHHGGKLGDVPPSMNTPKNSNQGVDSRVICSVGRKHPRTGVAPNGHPHADAIRNHVLKGWGPITYTFDGWKCVKCGAESGNYALSLGKTSFKAHDKAICASNMQLRIVT